MMNQVDKTEKSVVFKVTKPNGKLTGYYVFPRDKVGDSSSCAEFPTLKEARQFIGKGATAPSAA